MVDLTVIDVPLASVYLDSTYTEVIGNMIIGNMSGERQMLPDPDWKAKEQGGARAVGVNNNDDDDQGGDIPSWMFKEQSSREETKKGDSKGEARPAQEEKCIAGPVVVRAQVKKSDKIHSCQVSTSLP